MRLRNIRDWALFVTGHGHVGAGEEFDVHPEHVNGLIHQAYGEDAPYEPADDEAKAAVAEAQQPAEAPAEPAGALGDLSAASDAAAAQHQSLADAASDAAEQAETPEENQS